MERKVKEVLGPLGKPLRRHVSRQVEKALVNASDVVGVERDRGCVHELAELL